MCVYPCTCVCVCVTQVKGSEDEFLAYGLLYGLIACGFKGAGAASARQALCRSLTDLARPNTIHTATTASTAHTATANSSAAAAEQPSQPASPPADTHAGSKKKKKKRKQGDMSATQATPPVMCGPCVRHALRVLRAFRMGDWQGFISLYEGAMYMVPYLMDRILPTLRHFAIQVGLSKAQQVYAMHACTSPCMASGYHGTMHNFR